VRLSRRLDIGSQDVCSFAPEYQSTCAPLSRQKWQQMNKTCNGYTVLTG